MLKYVNKDAKSLSQILRIFHKGFHCTVFSRIKAKSMTRENTGHWKPVFSLILDTVYFSNRWTFIATMSIYQSYPNRVITAHVQCPSEWGQGQCKGSGPLLFCYFLKTRVDCIVMYFNFSWAVVSELIGQKGCTRIYGPSAFDVSCLHMVEPK